MSESKGYNGWKNYETWATALWIDNEESTYRYARSLIRQAVEEAQEADQVMAGVWTQTEGVRFLLADALKDWVTVELLPGLGATLAADLLGAAVEEVDWQEIADHFLSE